MNSHPDPGGLRRRTRPLHDVRLALPPPHPCEQDVAPPRANRRQLTNNAPQPPLALPAPKTFNPIDEQAEEERIRARRAAEEAM